MKSIIMRRNVLSKIASVLKIYLHQYPQSLPEYRVQSHSRSNFCLNLASLYASELVTIFT